MDAHPISDWSPRDVARNIVNQLFDLAEVSVERRQAINDACDEFVTDVLTDWRS